MNLAKALNIHDLRHLARRRLPRIVFDYIDGGAEDERGLAENIAAFARFRLSPRTLASAVPMDLSTALFGTTYALPFGIGPTGIAGLFYPRGDLHLAAAAFEAKIPYVMSGTSSAAIEDLAPEHARNAWYQLYTGRDKDIDTDILARARAAGMKTLVLTVDSEVRTKRERDLRNEFFSPRLKPSLLLEAFTHPAWVASYLANGGRPAFGNFAKYAGVGASALQIQAFMMNHLPGLPTWADLRRMRDAWTGRLVVKGILDPDDARRAADAGVDGIVVSNHGGRQLDRAPAPIDVLPHVRAAAGAMTVMMDGGIRRGADIITALCVGAQYVFLGRATLFGLAAAGRPGVRRAIEMLRQEIEINARQMGCALVADFTRERVYSP